MAAACQRCPTRERPGYVHQRSGQRTEVKRAQRAQELRRVKHGGFGPHSFPIEDSKMSKGLFDPDGGAFAENIRKLTGDDSALRESMKHLGWLEQLPAWADENGVVIIGHRRMKIAKELGINPVIQKYKFGNGDEADAKRLQLAIASNTGGKELTPKDRQRIAEYLYTKEKGW